MDDNARIYMTVPAEKLSEVIAELDKNETPEACAMRFGCDLVHVPQKDEPKPLRLFPNY